MKGAEILVVDDSLTVCRAIERILGPYGVEIATFSRGLDALERLRWARPDLVICDILLPDVKGYEICQYVRSTGEKVPVVLISGVVDDQVRQQAREAGAVGILRKPFTGPALLQAVQRLLSRSQPWQGEPASVSPPLPTPTRADRTLQQLQRIAGFHHGLLISADGSSTAMGSRQSGASVSLEASLRALVRAGRSLAEDLDGKVLHTILIETADNTLIVQPQDGGGVLVACVSSSALGLARHLLRPPRISVASMLIRQPLASSSPERKPD